MGSPVLTVAASTTTTAPQSFSDKVTAITNALEVAEGAFFPLFFKSTKGQTTAAVIIAAEGTVSSVLANVLKALGH